MKFLNESEWLRSASSNKDIPLLLQDNISNVNFNGG
jgi:hypothetical protein